MGSDAPADLPAKIDYCRDVLTEVLIYHQRTEITGCHCGWAELGHSYAGHVADVYEMEMRARTTPAEPVARCAHGNPSWADCTGCRRDAQERNARG